MSYRAIPSLLDVGEGEIEFSIFKHVFLIESNERYQDWWRNLSETERQQYQDEVDESYRQEREKEEEAWAKALENRDSSRKSSLRRMGIPCKDIDAILSSSLQNTDAIKIAKEFLADEDQTLLVLSGPRGCGKTTAAGYTLAASRYEWVDDPNHGEEELKKKARDMPCDGFFVGHFGGSKEEWGFIDVSRLARISRYDDDVMNGIERSRCIVIDDLGMEFADKGGSFLATLDGIVNARYAAMRTTIITTNLPAAEFKARYGERIADRVRESGRFVELNSESLRGRK